MTLNKSFLGQENSGEPELISVAELCKEQGITPSMVDKLIGCLQIKPLKHGKRSFLDRQQVGRMKELHRHYQETGRFDGFPILRFTEPKEETKTPQQESELPIQKIEESSEYTLMQML